MNRWITIGLVVSALIAIAFLTAAIFSQPFREISRDIAIVMIALFQIISSILLVVLLIAILYAVKAIREVAQTSVVPTVQALTSKIDQVVEHTSAIAGNARNTVSNVSTATGYVTEQVVAPVIRASSLFTGVRAAVGYLARRAPAEGDETP